MTGRDLVNNLAHQLQQSKDALTGARSDSAAWRVIPLLIGQPVVNSRYLVGALALSDMTVLRALDTLAERGVRAERTGFSRNRVWEHRGILNVLDAFADGIRRVR